MFVYANNSPYLESFKNQYIYHQAIEAVLKGLPDSVETESGRRETPQRAAFALAQLMSGYAHDPKSVLKVFDDIPAEQMVVVKDIEFTSLCEHHLLPFFGHAHIGYLPVTGKVVGISKLARVLRIYAARLQVQERIGQQVVDLLMNELNPTGVICVIVAQHLCMTARGVRAQDSSTVTSAFAGSFKEAVVRQEFFSLAGIHK